MNATPTTEAITSTARRLRPLAALVVLLVALFAGPVPVAQAATYVVDTTSDANLTACTGAAADCSLRGAINNANGSGGLDTIDFDIPGGGPHAITPSSALPDITDPVIIDGTSEPDFVGTPIVELDGTSVATDGLNITAGSSTVKGLVINSFGDNGIELSGSGGNTIQGNYIGTDVAGTADLGNSGNGVFIWGVPGNTIGGTAAGARNVISGNDKTGVSMMYGGEGGNEVLGNYIGTDASGTADLGNLEYGIYIDNVPDNTIGGTAVGARNVISGNDLDGIYIVLPGATGNTVQGNYIGTNAAGDTALLNQDNGVQIDTGAFGNTIGGDTAEERNVISGNGGSGVYIAGSGSDGNFVQGNYIGPNATGDGAIGNNVGVRIEGGADTNTVGGATAGERNVISGNVGPGVWISGSGTDGNNVKGNYIGTNAAGTAALPEPMFGWDGVRIQGGAQGNTIGGTTAGERNVISGNGDDCGSCAGVSIMGSGTDGNSVKGNYIGTNAAGTAAVANGLGVAISGSAFGNTIGGTTASERNVISGNTYAGVWINGSGTDGSNIKGNYIGTNGAGVAAVGNGEGVGIGGGAQGNTIGGTTAGERNVISGNTHNGVVIFSSGTTGNTVSGNYIGTDKNGTADLGNTLNGVWIADSASDNTIGGTVEEARNVISGNGGHGVRLEGSGTLNAVWGNYIGTDYTGTADVGNVMNGVAVSASSTSLVGGAAAGEGNVISGNGANGVKILDGSTANDVLGNLIGVKVDGTNALGNDLHGVHITASSGNFIGGMGESNTIAFNAGDGVFVESGTDNRIRGNSIHSNVGLGIDLELNGVTPNDGGDGDGGANLQMNFPIITSAIYDGVDTTISGTLDTFSPETATVDVYANEAADPSGNGEGQIYLGFTNAPGGSWSLVVPGTTTYGIYTATATDSVDNTSEFSGAFENDIDSDGILSGSDNCDTVYNPMQIDHDGDGIGDVCDEAVRNRYSAEIGASVVTEFTTAPGGSPPEENRAFHEWDYEPGGGIDVGAIVGSIDVAVTGLSSNGTCSSQVYAPGITLLNASIDNSPGNLIDTADLAADVDPVNGIPDGADKYPRFLNTILDPDRRTNVDEDGDGSADEDPQDGADDDADTLIDEDGIGTPEVPHARYFGVSGADIFQVLVFEEVPNQEYRVQVQYYDPTQAPAPPAGIPRCAPMEIRVTILDTSQDNLFTVPDESGYTVLNTPAAGTKLFHLQTVERPDADGDGVPTALDNCPWESNPGQEDGDADAIGDACEPVSGPCAGTASLDCDSDGRLNAYDNCPTEANPGQEESEIRTPQSFGMPPYNDYIGDVCDPNPTLPDHVTVAINEYSDGICVPGTDADGDGWCDTNDPDDGNSAKTPEGLAPGSILVPGSCSNGVDDDGDTDTDFDDSDCADADGDTIPDNVDNCAEAANPLQLDADTSTPAGDACEDAHIVGLEAVASTNDANSELRGRLMEPAPKMLHEFIGGIVTVTDPDWSIAPGGAVPNGAIREALTLAVTTSMSPSHTCNTSLPVNFTLVDASTDPTQTIDAGAGFSNLLNDADANELPDGVDLMPSFLVDLPGLDNDGDGRVDEDPPGGIPVIDGGVDVNRDTVIGVDDDGDYLGYQVIDGGMDIDGDTAVDASDDGIIAGVGIIDGSVDVNDDAAIDVDDDGDPWDDEDNDGDGRIDEDPLPLARLFGSSQGPTSATVLNVLIYNPVPLDNDGDGDVDEEVTPLVDDDGDTLIDEDTPEGYNAIFVLGDPTVSPFTGGISAFCTPFDMRQFRYAISLDNPSTASDEGDWTLLTNPSAGETERFFARVTTQPDKDGDGIENSLDTCVNEEDNDGDTVPDQSDPDPWDPRLVSPPGDADGDGIPAQCDPDGGGGGFLALTSCTDDWDCDTVNDTEDNCLVLSNTDQSDLDGDEIGDVCDDDTTLPNGATQHFNAGDPECINDDDLDKDGLCASLETALGTNDSDVKSVPETSLWDPGVCKDEDDNDGDGKTDLLDEGCGDLDNDGVLNDEDNCPLTPNGEDEAGEPGVGDQTDFDSDTGPGDVGSQPFLRSTLGDPEGAPSDVLGAPFLRSDKWGGDACDPDDDNDFLPDGSEPAGTCISTLRSPQFDDDCDKDYLGDLVEYISSPLCELDPNCNPDPPAEPWPNPPTSNYCLDPLAADDYTANPDGDSLFTYGEAVIYLEAVIRGETFIPMRPCEDDDTWLTVDSDGDGFNLGMELFGLTDPQAACTATTDSNDEEPDAWPPDFDDNTVINITDVFKVLPPVFGSSLPGGPPYTRRIDLAPSGVINITDVFRVLPPFFGTSCTPP